MCSLLSHVLGDNVYCYAHSNSIPYFTQCSEWTVKTIQDRFGYGIPSDIDAAVGKWNEWVFHFVKGNMLYTSTGDSSTGTLDDTTPVFVQIWYQKFLCDASAIMQGMNMDQYFFYAGSKQYYCPSSGTLESHSKICHG